MFDTDACKSVCSPSLVVLNLLAEQARWVKWRLDQTLGSCAAPPPSSVCWDWAFGGLVLPLLPSACWDWVPGGSTALFLSPHTGIGSKGPGTIPPHQSPIPGLGPGAHLTTAYPSLLGLGARSTVRGLGLPGVLETWQQRSGTRASLPPNIWTYGSPIGWMTAWRAVSSPQAGGWTSCPM